MIQMTEQQFRRLRKLGRKAETPSKGRTSPEQRREGSEAQGARPRTPEKFRRLEGADGLRPGKRSPSTAVTRVSRGRSSASLARNPKYGDNLSESAILRQVTDWLEWHKWKVIRLHVGVFYAQSDKARKYPITMNEEGTADLLVIRDEWWVGKSYARAVFIETKTARGRQRAAQKLWQLSMEKRGFVYLVARSAADLERQFQERGLPI